MHLSLHMVEEVSVNSGGHFKISKPKRGQEFQFKNAKYSDQILQKSTIGIIPELYTMIQISTSTSDRGWTYGS